MSDHPATVTRYTGSGGVSLAADVGGDPGAPTVILMHGGGQTRHSWSAAMQELLRQGYRVINLDSRGHGDSDWAPDGDYSLDALAADLFAVIATLPSRPALVGASMGGATLLHAAGTAGRLLAAALVLVDIVPRVEAEGVGKIGAFMRRHPEGFATLDEAADAVAAYNPLRPRRADPSGLMKNLRRRDDGRLYWHWDPAFLTQPQRSEPPDFRETLLADARCVQSPTLLIRGLHSDIVSDAGIAELKDSLPALEVSDIAGAGHMVVGDRNDVFNNAVLAFLRQHLPLPATLDGSR